jgi:hypothetical protein
MDEATRVREKALDGNPVRMDEAIGVRKETVDGNPVVP